MACPETRFTRRFGLRHPVALAPMAGAAGGALAAAVSGAGGLGLLGGGYGQPGWIAAQKAEAGSAPVGIGFITWSLSEAVLSEALGWRPQAVMLSFGDPAAHAARVRAAGVPLIVQVQSLEMARRAVDCGAEVIVAQGSEAGGHGATRAVMTLVPEIADDLAQRAPEVLLLAAGGIADGRGLAAALMLGADGALVGSRFWASAEALVPEGFHRAAWAASGDQTLRSALPDAARELSWPAPFTIRTLQSRFSDHWQHRPEALRAPEAAEARRAWGAAQQAGDAANGSPIVGEAVGLIRNSPPAAEVLEQLSREAAACLARGAGR